MFEYNGCGADSNDSIKRLPPKKISSKVVYNSLEQGFGLLLLHFLEDATFIRKVFVPALLSQVGTSSSMFMVTSWWTSGKKLIDSLSYLIQW